MNKNPVKEIAGAYVIEISRHKDDRGYFQEVYSSRKYSFTWMDIAQTNVSCSQKNVVRGMHVAPFAKLCTCIKGKLYDVVADVRPTSPTFKNWYAVWLDSENCKQLFVPAGCAHGFFAAENDTILMYQQGGRYDPELEFEINWRDPDLNITWPEADEYLLSNKDLVAKELKDVLA